MLALKATVANCRLNRVSILRNALSERKLATSIEPDVRMSFTDEKQKFLGMPLEEKRLHYKKKPVTAEEISPWSEYWNKNKCAIPATAGDTEEVEEWLANKVILWQGDITTLEIDAIVNAANSSLLGGGGVDGAIHAAAGPYLKKECASLGGCRVGEAKITGAYKLPARYIIHTVGPQGEKLDKLEECYENCLKMVQNHHLRTVAFPCISTGIYGCPQKPAARTAISTVKEFLLKNKDAVDKVIFCVFLKTDKEIYQELLQKYFDYKKVDTGR